jgi:hypothetical protein
VTLNVSGPISLAGTTAGQSIQIELGGTGSTQISLNDVGVRTLAGVPSGQIVMPTDFYGKSNRVSLVFAFSTSTANAALNVSSLVGYVAGSSDITITVNSSVYLYATSTANAGLTLSGGTTGDTITLVNNGFIMGQGGTGGRGVTPVQPTAGGPALSLGFNTTVNNTNASAYIGGGGGGGGGVSGGTVGYGGGGGAGGGAGGASNFTSGGTGGAIGASGTNGGATGGANYAFGGGGGGRIFPSTTIAGPTRSGTPAAAGGNGGSGGGSGGVRFSGIGGSGTGGSGGGPATVGGNGSASTGGSSVATGGGGGWGATGGNSVTFAAGLTRQNGAAGGRAVNLNGSTITWVSGDTTRVYGAVA